MKKNSPDEIDLAIMLALRAYPVPTLRQIGETIGRSHVTVMQRLKWLGEVGLVTKSGRSNILSAKGFEYLTAQEARDTEEKRDLGDEQHTTTGTTDLRAEAE